MPTCGASGLRLSRRTLTWGSQREALADVPAPQNVSLPPFFTLTNGYTVRVTALDPTSGAVVAGVIASNVSIAVDQSGPVPTEEQPKGPVFLIPGPAVPV